MRKKPPLQLFPSSGAAKANASSKPNPPEAKQPPVATPANPMVAQPNQTLAPATEHEESVRLHYLGQETAVKLVALLYLIVGLATLALGVLNLAASGGASGSRGRDTAIVGLMLIVSSVAPLMVAYGLVRFKPWARGLAIGMSLLQLAATAISLLPCIVVMLKASSRGASWQVKNLATTAMVGLFACGISAWISIGIFRLFRSEAGQVVFSDSYQHIAKRTRHVRKEGSREAALIFLLGIGVLAGFVYYLQVTPA